MAFFNWFRRAQVPETPTYTKDVIHCLPRQELNELVKLIDGPHTGASVAEMKIKVLFDDGRRYVELGALLEWLARLSESVASDQKREAYRGLRRYLSNF